MLRPKELGRGDFSLPLFVRIVVNTILFDKSYKKLNSSLYLLPKFLKKVYILTVNRSDNNKDTKMGWLSVLICVIAGVLLYETGRTVLLAVAIISAIGCFLVLGSDA